MAGEVLKQLYKRTKTGEMAGLSKIWPNFNHIDVETVEDTSDEGLTAEYGQYDLVVCADKKWYMQYDRGKWINGGSGDSPTPPEPPTPTADDVYYGYADSRESINFDNKIKATVTNNTFNTPEQDNPYHTFYLLLPTNKSLVSCLAGGVDNIASAMTVENVTIDELDYKLYHYTYGDECYNAFTVTMS